MPFYRPTLEQIIARVTSDVEYEMGSTAARIPGTIEYALVRGVAGLSHNLHGRLAQIAKDAFPHSAEDVEMQKWAAFFDVFRIPAVPSLGVLLFNGTNGSAIPVGTRLVRADKREYKTIEAAVIAGGEAQVAAESVLPGLGADVLPGATFTLKDPLEGVYLYAQTATGFAGAADLELYRDLRRRLLARIRNPPKGGGPGDYIAWAKRVPGVTRVWEYGKIPSLGHVTVLAMRDLDEDPIPGVEELAAIEAEIQKFCPLHLAGLHVLAPNSLDLELEIDLLVEDNEDEAAVKAAIGKSIQDMLATRAIPAKQDGVVLYRSWISEAISTTPGEKDHKLLSPADDIVLTQWQLPALLDPVAQIDWV